MKTEGIRIGALGAGGFGLFALQQFTQIPGVELVGMAATHREAAFAMIQRFGPLRLKSDGAAPDGYVRAPSARRRLHPIDRKVRERR